MLHRRPADLSPLYINIPNSRQQNQNNSVRCSQGSYVYVPSLFYSCYSRWKLAWWDSGGNVFDRGFVFESNSRYVCDFFPCSLAGSPRQRRARETRCELAYIVRHLKGCVLLDICDTLQIQFDKTYHERFWIMWCSSATFPVQVLKRIISFWNKVNGKLPTFISVQLYSSSYGN